MEDYTIGFAPKTGQIYAGGKTKFNVTEKASLAVAEHLIEGEKELILRYKDKLYVLKAVQIESIQVEETGEIIKCGR